MKVALVADWLPTFGGAEHVIAELCSLFPDAPLYTTVARHGHLGPLDNQDIRTTRLQLAYRAFKNHQILLPWMPRALEDIDLHEYDLILSSSHAVAKGIVPPSHAKHICYCHTPMRYAWEMEDQYLKDFHVPRLLKRPIRKKLKALRRWDLTTAQRVDHFIANSTETQERIHRIYNRESTVIPPPVDAKFFSPAPMVREVGERKSYFLAIGRLVPYKRFDLLIECANLLKLPLHIAGTGQDEKRLKKLAGSTVKFLGYVPDADLPMLYAHAQALLFPQHEDAGVVPLEAQATGTPVIAYGRGGALDTVVQNHTGIFFSAQNIGALSDAIDRFRKSEWRHDQISDHAQQFSSAEFRRKITTLVKELV